MKRFKVLLVLLSITIIFAGCGNKSGNQTNDQADAADKSSVTETDHQGADEIKEEPVTILIAAAASMQKSLDEFKTMFQAKYPWITVEATYDSSGKLQTQIEEGMEADIFLSAAKKQMNTLADENLVDADSIVELLENKVVLIVTQDAESKVTNFNNILNAERIAIGEPASVPAGQYAKEVFDSLGIFSDVEAKASLGTNVTEVLNWVAEGSADAGVVYATDAATTDKVAVVAEAPKGTLKEAVIYPVGIVSGSTKKEASQLYIDFLQTEEAKALFEKYGFVAK